MYLRLKLVFGLWLSLIRCEIKTLIFALFKFKFREYLRQISFMYYYWMAFSTIHLFDNGKGGLGIFIFVWVE
jgi:hypothetical protein